MANVRGIAGIGLPAPRWRRHARRGDVASPRVPRGSSRWPTTACRSIWNIALAAHSEWRRNASGAPRLMYPVRRHGSSSLPCGHRARARVTNQTTAAAVRTTNEEKETERMPQLFFLFFYMWPENYRKAKTQSSAPPGIPPCGFPHSSKTSPQKRRNYCKQDLRKFCIYSRHSF